MIQKVFFFLMGFPVMHAVCFGREQTKGVQGSPKTRNGGSVEEGKNMSLSLFANAWCTVSLLIGIASGMSVHHLFELHVWAMAMRKARLLPAACFG